MSTPVLFLGRAMLWIALACLASQLVGTTPPDPWTRIPGLPSALIGQGSTTEFLEIAPWQAARDHLQAVQRAFQHRQGQPLRTEAYWMKK